MTKWKGLDIYEIKKTEDFPHTENTVYVIPTTHEKSLKVVFDNEWTITENGAETNVTRKLTPLEAIEILINEIERLSKKVKELENKLWKYN